MKSLHVRFGSMLSAQKAVEQLKNLGYKNAYLDAADLFKEEQAMELTFPHSKKSSSLSSLVLKSNSFMYHVGKGPLTAASSAVSGMASYGESANAINAAVMVQVEDEDVEKVRSLLHEYGGNP